MSAQTFDGHIIAMAEESPRAVVLEWYVRLDLACQEYLQARRLSRRSGPSTETLIESDTLLGKHIASEVMSLRLLRNQVAHEGLRLSSAEAIAFATRCLAVLGALAAAIDSHAAT